MLNALFRQRLYLCLAALILLLLILCQPKSRLTGLERGLRWWGEPARQGAGKVLEKSRELLQGEQPMLTREQQEELLSSLAVARRELAVLHDQDSSLLEENRQLREQLQLVSQARQYTFCVAEVLQRDPLGDYYGTLLLGKGSRDGLKAGQAVLSPSGLLGVIQQVSAATAQVQLLGHRDFTLPCQLPAKRLTGLLAAAPRRAEPPELPSLLLPPESLSLQATAGLEFDHGAVGDQVVTSSLGNPEMLDGIIIGTVNQLDTDTAGAPVLQVKPAATLAQLSFVLVAIPAPKF